MKNLLPKLLFALMIAALLLSPAALMEEEIEAVEPVDELVEEQSVDIVEEDTLGGDEVITYTGDTYAAGQSDELFAAAGEVAINATNFPDEALRDYLLSNGDTDHNGSLSAAEIATIIDLKCNPNDFTGIKYLTSVESITTGFETVKLDVSGLTKLKSLAIFSNALTSLNINGCTGLEELSLPDQMTKLDISGTTGIDTLTIFSNSLTSLNASNCPSLKSLKCTTSQLTSLNLSGCSSLEELDCSGDFVYRHPLTSVDVSNCASLKTLNCDCNQLTSLNISGCTSLEELRCSANQLTSLDVSGLPNLSGLSCGYNQLTSLNVSGCANLTTLSCDVNQLTSLDVSSCTNLTRLVCYLNKELSSLNVRGLKLLEELNCNSNKLASVDITGCTKLVQCYTKGTYSKSEGHDWYQYSNGSEGATLVVDRGQKVVTGLSTKSSSKTKTKVANKKLKVTAYVGTPVQMETGGETGKSFKSSNKKIATVNSKGVVTPKSAGKCKITYKTSSANYTVTLTVKDLTIPKWIALNLKGTIAAKVGEPQTLTATMNSGAVSKLKWTTSNKKIATVKNGVVMFKKKGTVTITVTTVKGNKKAKVKFKVTK